MKRSAVVPVIIIDYFSAARTRQCMEDYTREMKGADLRFVIVDNSADEGNYVELTAGSQCEEQEICGCRVLTSPNAAYIYTGVNAGFARGNNIGFRIARELYDFDYVLFSNNDIQLQDFDTSVLIADLQEHLDVAVVGPKVTGLDGRAQSPHGYRSICRRWLTYTIYPFDRYLRGYSEHLLKNAKSGYVYRIIGAFMLCDAAKFEQAGCFDENTFLYAEELILSERLHKYGYKTWYDRELGIIHEGGYTTSKAGESLAGSKRTLESNLYYYEKYRGVPKIIITITRGFYSFYALKWKMMRPLKRMLKRD